MPTAGFPDPTFGAAGVVRTDVGLPDSYERAWDVAAYPAAGTADPKVVAVGTAATRLRGGFYDQDWAIVRYNPDGSLDPSFGSGGKVTTAFTSQSDAATGVEVLPDGKLVVAGFAGSNFALARYTAAGALDKTFGNKGKVTTPVGQWGGGGLAMELQADGRIVVAGVDSKATGFNDLAVIRYTSSGALDPTFSGDGKLTLSFSHSVSGLPRQMDVAVYETGPHAGKILVVGRLDNTQPNQAEVFVARFNADGTTDSTFGSGGVLTVPGLSFSTGPGSGSPAVTLLPDGRFVVVANGDPGGSTDADLHLIRFNADGSLDATFGSGGTSRTALPGNQVATAIEVLPDGRLVVAGYDAQEDVELNGANFLVARFLSDGTPDSSFGVNGVGLTTGGRLVNDNVELAVQSNGKLVIAGGGWIPEAGPDTIAEFQLARFTGDDALMAASVAPQISRANVLAAKVQPLLAQAISRWQAAGADTSALPAIDLRIADFGGAMLGLASGNTIPGDQGEAKRMDLLTVLEHEIGHLRGQEHETDGVMAETLTAAGTPGSFLGSDLVEVAALDGIFADGKTSLAALFAGESTR